MLSRGFFELGRRLGHAAIPTARKAVWAWKSLTATETDSIRAEIDLGAALAAEMRLRVTSAADPGDSVLVNHICRRLSGTLRNEPRPFMAEAIQLGSPTAIALPGGFIFVDPSLLDLCGRQPDEVAFVVGHEMAHVIRQHAFKRIATRVGCDVLSVLLRRGMFAGWWRQPGLRLLQSAYSRDSELEADKLGARLAGAAGYDPAAAFRLLARLDRLHGASAGLSEYFASHPPANERIANLRARSVGDRAG